MSSSRTEITFDKMRYDIHEGVKQLKRIADALDRAYPKRKLEDATDEGDLFDRHPPIETVDSRVSYRVLERKC